MAVPHGMRFEIAFDEIHRVTIAGDRFTRGGHALDWSRQLGEVGQWWDGRAAA